jgi:trimeric autotransporter adhesin
MKTQSLRTPRFLALFALGCLALFPIAQAVNPPPDGGYAGFNTAEGQNALFNLSTGVGNTALGWFSLWSNTDGSFNTAVGTGTLLFNVGDQSTGEGTRNTAVGTAALLFNTAGARNTAFGVAALSNNDDGAFNTATGDQALFSNTTGTGNTANGSSALFSNTVGGFNTADGYLALVTNDSGDGNTAIGYAALNTSTGIRNTALGRAAGIAVTTANNVICIGADVSGENIDNSCYIGQIYSNIQPQVGTDPDLVTINSNGRLGRANVSSRRYKHNIRPMHKASEAIYALKPVSFRYHTQYDATQTTAFGLIAEDVAEVAPDLVGRNEKGEPESVRYEQINAMLLNEFLKEHARVEEQDRKIEKQEATITQLKRDMDALVACLREENSKIQRVTDRIESTTPEAQMALND